MEALLPVHPINRCIDAFFQMSLWFTMASLLAVSAVIQGCGGSSGSGGSNESAYYDQLWAIAKESITPGMTDAEVAEALARWIVDNSTNARWVPEDSYYPLPEGVRGSDGELLPFHGLCGGRSHLFEHFATRAGLTASVFNIYNFGGPGGGHTCVQVYYENDWHFFDVTYAGIFKIDGEILSFEEMRADPGRAIAGMVVFEPTGDTRDYYSNGFPADNNIRMQGVYTDESLANAISTSFWGSGNLVPLEVLVDLSQVPIQLGDAARDADYLDAYGMNQGVSEQLGVMLGHVRDNFEPVLRITNAVPGQAYILKFYIYFATADNLQFKVIPSDGVEILTGLEMEVLPGMISAEEPLQWEIVFRPRAETADFTIHNDCSSGEGLLLNQIVIESIFD